MGQSILSQGYAGTEKAKQENGEGMSGRMSLLDSKEKLRCNVRYLHRGAHVSSAQVHTSSPELTRRQHGRIGKPRPVASCRVHPGPWSRLLAVEAVSAPTAGHAPGSFPSAACGVRARRPLRSWCCIAFHGRATVYLRMFGSRTFGRFFISGCYEHRCHEHAFR